MNPVVLHLVRPYASEEALLAAEAWTIDARGMLLLEQAPLANDTIVVFDVALESGDRVIRAEARVVGHVAANDRHAGGLRVRFRRYGSQTKAFVERAVAYRQQRRSARPSAAPATPSDRAEAVAPPEPAPAPIAEAATKPELPPHPPLAKAPAVVVPLTPRSLSDANETSGIHRRLVPSVVAPPNRDELLERLRERSRSRRASEPEAPTSHRTG